MNPDAAPRGQDLLREMGGPAWRPYDAIPPQKPGWRWRIARIFVRMIVRNPLRVARSKFLRRAFAVAFYEVLFVISGDGDDGMVDASADLRVLVKVGRMTVARDWALVLPGDEYKLDDDGEWRVK